MKWLLAVGLLFLVGCMSVNTRPLDPSVDVAGQGKNVITVERGSYLPPYNSMPVTIFIDGKPAREIGGGKTVNLHVAYGRHSVGVATGRATEPQREIAVDVSATESPILRASMVAMMYGGFRLVRIN